MLGSETSGEAYKGPDTDACDDAGHGAGADIACDSAAGGESCEGESNVLEGCLRE